MKFSTNKEKGNSGIGVAIGYFTTEGNIVSIPINDTQDYDLVVDIENSLKKVQVKATTEKERSGATRVSLASNGGTKGVRYKTVSETDIDLVFVVNELQEKWIIPKEIVTVKTYLTLGKKYSRYKV